MLFICFLGCEACFALEVDRDYINTNSQIAKLQVKSKSCFN